MPSFQVAKERGTNKVPRLSAVGLRLFRLPIQFCPLSQQFCQVIGLRESMN